MFAMWPEVRWYLACSSHLLRPEPPARNPLARGQVCGQQGNARLLFKALERRADAPATTNKTPKRVAKHSKAKREVFPSALTSESTESGFRATRKHLK